MATSISTTAGALSTGLLQAINASPYAMRTYYSCTQDNRKKWICVKGMSGVQDSWYIVVDVCSFQPDTMRRRVIAKCLDVSKDQVEIRD